MLVSACCHGYWVGKLDVGSAAAFQLEVFRHGSYSSRNNRDSGFGVASGVRLIPFCYK